MRRWMILLTFAALACVGCSDQVSELAAAPDEASVVRVTGELQSANSYFFGPPPIQDIWNYTIAYMAPDGEVVEAGKPVLRFDAQELMSKLRDKNNAQKEKQTELDKARIVARETLAELGLQVKQAKADLDKARLKADIPANLLAARGYRENQLLLKLAELQYALNQAELEKEKAVQDTEIRILEREIGVLEVEAGRLQASISKMTIIAPGPGVVIHVRDRRNNKMATGDTVWGGRRVIEFPDLSQLEAHIQIPERASAQIRRGQRVRITMDAVPDRAFYGELVELASVIHTRSTNQPDKVFDATVRLSNPDPELMRPGMNINAEILVDGVAEVAGL